ncbi:precorrin-3B C(17)-methyltransferase [Phormidium sp. FACHB-592]|uniref:Precorrin-3B C(17)-methyltransferase n=1 Tax=Stenomitos frigidus AS-A4 TaxID=2933935 RepID=A0ABV0KNQ6_9CYAN|nr:precorrin-3B C(17)-methyltransferase [Phormidium sp. FACHB-592]MBD2077309.1 precorrin-3B C(17)-methyltransferase [Phormidium sp. FACHB-592]
MRPPVVIILGETSVAIARQIQAAVPAATIYGLAGRTQSVDVLYANFGDTVRELFSKGTPIIGICAAGILIRSLATLLTDKRAEPPVIAVADDGSAVVPLLGGLTGANELATTLARALDTNAAITATGQLRFNIVLEAPPRGYRLVNPEHAKAFTSDLISGATVRLLGDASWLSQSNLPFTTDGTHTIEVSDRPVAGSATHLVYQPVTVPGKLAIVGTGPGAVEWMSPEVKAILLAATDLVGYKTYLDLVGAFAQGKRHESDNRVELDRARQALELAAEGRSVVVVSSGDPGIYAMAAAVFEVIDREANPAWQQLEIHVAPGISAMQAAAAAIGAPLGHDFCAISLSDILKPWSVIEERIALAAQADFAMAFYNPVSKQRTWQLDKAKEILMKWRSPATPVVLARNLGRSGQSVQVIALDQLTAAHADMRTVLLIGSSKTRTIARADGNVWVYTPRHYEG